MEYDVKYYQQVAEELRATGAIEGLWLKALTVANADKEKAKALYVKWRLEQIVAAELQESKHKASYTIACPKCHATETILSAHVKNPSAYTTFNISYNSFLGRIKFSCNHCGKVFKRDTQLLE